MNVIDIITYALLKKRITSALTGIKDIRLDGERTILFITNDDKEFKINIPTPDIVYVGDTEPPEDSQYELWIDTSDDGTTPLNRAVLSDDITASTIIGSVTSGKTYPVGTNLEAILRDILTSYSKPTVVLNLSPAIEIYDAVTDTLSSITANAKVTKGTNKIESVKFFIDAVEDKEITEEVANGGTFSSLHEFDPPTGKTFTVKVTVNDGQNNTTVTKTVTFVGKSYFGFLPRTVETPTEDDILGLDNSTLKNSKNLTYANIAIPQDGELYKICYAYPKSLNALTKIVDKNGFDYFNSYEKHEVVVNDIPYFCYIMKKGSGAAGATHIYS